MRGMDLGGAATSSPRTHGVSGSGGASPVRRPPPIGAIFIPTPTSLRAHRTSRPQRRSQMIWVVEPIGDVRDLACLVAQELRLRHVSAFDPSTAWRLLRKGGTPDLILLSPSLVDFSPSWRRWSAAFHQRHPNLRPTSIRSWTEEQMDKLSFTHRRISPSRLL